MDVFVIPLGRERYELYCETSARPLDPEQVAPGLIGRLRHRVAMFIHEAETRRHADCLAGARRTFRARIRARAMAWVAERIAEQRLLWNLRGETAATLAHPEAMSFEQTRALVDGMLEAAGLAG
mgnify:CR=1 FL=1